MAIFAPQWGAYAAAKWGVEGLTKLAAEEVKGQGIHGYCLLRHGHKPSDQLADEVREHVARHLGPIVRPEKVTFVDALPKTRSGKIMRRVLKARAQGLPEGDVSTLERTRVTGRVDIDLGVGPLKLDLVTNTNEVIRTRQNGNGEFR